MTQPIPRNRISVRLLTGALVILLGLASSAAANSGSNAATSNRSQTGGLVQVPTPTRTSAVQKTSASIAAAATHWMPGPGGASIPVSVDLNTFVQHVSDGQPGVIRGVFVPGRFALSVIQQPANEKNFVSRQRDQVTQLERAARNGVTGLLAHNYLSGRLFYQLGSGQEVFIVYGDGALQRYRVTNIYRFQKLTPTSLSSDLVDLSTGEELTSTQVFNRFYRGEPHLTFQTCLRAGSQWDWGLTFVTATPVAKEG